MMTKEMNGTKMTVTGGECTDKELEAYRAHVAQEFDIKTVSHIDINLDGDFADINTYFHPVPFERIRRITGYLVGSLDHFNNAKRAEVNDRVKHM